MEPIDPTPVPSPHAATKASVTVTSHRPLHPLALASLITGILSPCSLGLLGVVAILLGSAARRALLLNPEAKRGLGMARAGMVTGGIGLFLGLAPIALLLYQNNATLTTTHLDVAEKALFASSAGDVAFANLPQAQPLAETMAITMETFAAALPEKPSGLSIMGDKFLCYTWRSKRGIAFLLSVPNLRKYSDAAKESLTAEAWRQAQRLALEAKLAPGSPLALATRGSLAYEQILIGKVLAADEEAQPGSFPGATNLQAKEKELERFFR